MTYKAHKMGGVRAMILVMTRVSRGGLGIRHAASGTCQAAETATTTLYGRRSSVH